MPKPNESPAPVDYRGIKASKIWITRKETASFTIDGHTMYFESSIGLGAESDNPQHRSYDIYDAASRSLNVLFERERRNWLSAKVAEMEKLRIESEVAALNVPDEPTDSDTKDGVPDLTIVPAEAPADPRKYDDEDIPF